MGRPQPTPARRAATKACPSFSEGAGSRHDVDVPHVSVVATTALSPAGLASLRALLDEAFGGDFGDDDWAHTLGGQHVLVTSSGTLAAHAAVVPRTLWVGDTAFRCGYVEGVATLPSHRRGGLGSLATRRAADLVRAAYDLGALSTGSPSFYERLGWERWRGETYVRDGARVLRTPDEDDGVMVLRHGPSAVADLAAPIACEARRGDDW